MEQVSIYGVLCGQCKNSHHPSCVCDANGVTGHHVVSYASLSIFKPLGTSGVDFSSEGCASSLICSVAPLAGAGSFVLLVCAGINYLWDIRLSSKLMRTVPCCILTTSVVLGKKDKVLSSAAQFALCVVPAPTPMHTACQ